MAAFGVHSDRLAAARLHAAAHLTTRAGPGWRRPVAAAIDLTLFLLAAPLTVGLPGMVAGPFWPAGSALIAIAGLALGWAEGGTPGQRLCGLRLVAPNGRPVPYRLALLRAVLVTAEAGSLLFLANIALIGWGRGPAHAAVVVAATAIGGLGVIDLVRLLCDSSALAVHDRLSRTLLVQAGTPRRPGTGAVEPDLGGAAKASPLAADPASRGA